MRIQLVHTLANAALGMPIFDHFNWTKWPKQQLACADKRSCLRPRLNIEGATGSPLTPLAVFKDAGVSSDLPEFVGFIALMNGNRLPCLTARRWRNACENLPNPNQRNVMPDNKAERDSR